MLFHSLFNVCACMVTLHCLLLSFFYYSNGLLRVLWPCNAMIIVWLFFCDHTEDILKSSWWCSHCTGVCFSVILKAKVKVSFHSVICHLDMLVLFNLAYLKICCFNVNSFDDRWWNVNDFLHNYKQAKVGCKRKELWSFSHVKEKMCT